MIAALICIIAIYTVTSTEAFTTSSIYNVQSGASKQYGFGGVDDDDNQENKSKQSQIDKIAAEDNAYEKREQQHAVDQDDYYPWNPDTFSDYSSTKSQVQGGATKEYGWGQYIPETEEVQEYNPDAGYYTGVDPSNEYIEGFSNEKYQNIMNSNPSMTEQQAGASKQFGYRGPVEKKAPEPIPEPPQKSCPLPFPTDNVPVPPDDGSCCPKEVTPEQMDKICRECDITKNKDIDKYVLKSSVPPSPNMNNFVKKNEIPPYPDMSKYILKNQIPPCGKPDYKNYIHKSKLPACPKCPTCPTCPDCPPCPNCPAKKDLRAYEEVLKDITKHPQYQAHFAKCHENKNRRNEVSVRAKSMTRGLEPDSKRGQNQLNKSGSKQNNTQKLNKSVQRAEKRVEQRINRQERRLNHETGPNNGPNNGSNPQESQGMFSGLMSYLPGFSSEPPKPDQRNNNKEKRNPVPSEETKTLAERTIIDYNLKDVDYEPSSKQKKDLKNNKVNTPYKKPQSSSHGVSPYPEWIDFQ